MEINKNEFFREATLRICGSLNIENALPRVLVYLQQFMPITDLRMGLYEPKFNTGRWVAGASSSEQQTLEPVIQLPAELWEEMIARWNEEPDVVIQNDIDKEDPIIQELTFLIWQDRNISTISMDLELEKERVGAVVVKTSGKNQYTKAQGRLIALLHEPFAIAMSNILQHQEVLRLKDMLADDNQYLHRELFKLSGDRIVGAEFGLKNVMEMVRQVAPLDSPVLLFGETGVGKEVIANSLHYSSHRKKGPFIKVNCGAIPEHLIDSELFGHEKGSFTGAIATKRGRFERAHEGTIFLDEIGELPPAAQVRLLRVLQNKEIERIGGTETIPVDVRIISATHQNLEEMIESGSFREDLWFRLNVFPITIPPLRHRKDDIPALVQHFIQRKSRDLKIQNPPGIDPQAMERLKHRQWPGNVRELENMVERELIHNIGNQYNDLLFFHQVPFSGQTPKPDNFADEGPVNILPLENMVRNHIQRTLIQVNGKVEGKDGAAKLLNVHPSTLRGKMKRLDIPYGRKTAL